MENIVTQENLPNSCEEPQHMRMRKQSTKLDKPLAQYYDVEMELVLPNPAGDNLNRHATQLFAPAKSCEKLNTAYPFKIPKKS